MGTLSIVKGPELDVNTILFRCSSIGHLMPGPKEKEGQIQQTTKTHLVDVFVSWKYGRREEVVGKNLDKGNEREEDSVTLVSLVKKKFYKKNNIRLSNEFITGEWDLSDGEPIEETLDTKTSWSAHTFFRSKNKPLEDDYKWQGHGYMWLTGAKKHTVCYCLVNGTAQAIRDEKRKLAWRYGSDPDAHPEYVKKCKQVEINHIFDMFSFKEENPGFDFHSDLSEWKYDIPMIDRLHTFTFDRDEAKIEAIKQRVADCRDWIKNNLL
jgi:hypothetical protein